MRFRLVSVAAVVAIGVPAFAAVSPPVTAWRSDAMARAASASRSAAGVSCATERASAR